jgi:hypothetical protein
LQVPDQVPGRTPVFVFRKRRKILVKPENLSVASIQEAFEEVCKSLACDELAMTLKDLATHRSLSLNCTLVAERASTGRLDKATSSRTAKHPQSGVVYSSIIDVVPNRLAMCPGWVPPSQANRAMSEWACHLRWLHKGLGTC